MTHKCLPNGADRFGMAIALLGVCSRPPAILLDVAPPMPLPAVVGVLEIRPRSIRSHQSHRRRPLLGNKRENGVCGVAFSVL